MNQQCSQTLTCTLMDALMDVCVQIPKLLTQLGKTADGLRQAYLRLELTGTDMSHCGDLSGHVHLQTLVLKSNELKDLRALSSLRSLTHLDVSENKLTQVPACGCVGRGGGWLDEWLCWWRWWCWLVSRAVLGYSRMPMHRYAWQVCIGSIVHRLMCMPHLALAVHHMALSRSAAQGPQCPASMPTDCTIQAAPAAGDDVVPMVPLMFARC